MPYLKEIEELFHAGNDHPSESAKAACLIEQCHTVSKNVKVMFHVVSLNAGWVRQFCDANHGHMFGF